eukprot:1191591-Prorocentrum_minimum.AAC.2
MERKVVREAAAQSGQTTWGAGAPPSNYQRNRGNVPKEFVIGDGTLLHDASSKGDVDAVLGGKASLSAMQTWPHAHPFCLLDSVVVETLRECENGLPAWLSRSEAEGCA